MSIIRACHRVALAARNGLALLLYLRINGEHGFVELYEGALYGFDAVDSMNRRFFEDA